MRVADEESSSQEIKRGVRQGCVFLPELLNLNSEMIRRDLLNFDVFKFGGWNIINVRYTNDTVLIADSEEKLQTLVQSLVRVSGER